jgi:hypothetical protein
VAIVVTGEYYQANGNSNGAVTNAIMLSINGITAIYQRDLCVDFQLMLPPNYSTDPNNDPFDPNGDRVGQSVDQVEANFPGGNYDFGHVFHTTAGGGSGVANLGVICDNSVQGNGFAKGGGWSGSSNNNSAGWFSLAGHEFGHMFNMTHTFNGGGSFCAAAISETTAYEIGSGSTIMSYNGVCDDAQNLPQQTEADNYFHVNSLERAVNYMNTQTCHTGFVSINTPPVANPDPCGNGPYSIPTNTPFRLRGSAVDANGDQIFYCWEQFDEDGAGTPTQGLIGINAANSTTAPLFRSYPPTTSPTRTFPNMDLVRTNQYTSSFEPLPQVARTLNFRLTARDWRAAGGGIDTKSLQVTVTNDGPLAVTAPNGGENLTAGNQTNVTWSVNGTSNICNSVNIKLSIDGGSTFPYTLASNETNDGAATVNIPAGVINTNQARIMVESACNTCVVFFDISNNNFTITSTCNAGISAICPTQAMNGQANTQINLALNSYFGGIVTQAPYNIDANNSPSGPIANDDGNGGCQTPGNGTYNIFDFTVSNAGNYTFTRNRNDNNFVITSLFVAAGYNPANPCASTFLGSESTGAYSLSGNGITANLNACTTYKLVMWSLNETMNGNIEIAGPGSVLSAGAGPGAGFAYTYVAVNTADNQVKAINNASTFTLAGGTYHIYGASYATGINTANWVNMTLAQILSGGGCVLFSSNFKVLTIAGGGGGCTPPTINNVTATQPQDCNNPLGSISINAVGQGVLEYSVNNGANWQVGNNFNNLPPGAYTVLVRIQGNAGCQTAYGMNPVNLNAPAGCCNLPTYMNACTSGDFINSFVFGAFTSANSTGCGGAAPNNRSNYQPLGPTVQPGQSYQVTIGAGTENQFYAVYIDFDGNGSFLDAGEFFNIGQAQANMTATAMVMIPANAAPGTRAMRVRSAYNNDTNPLTAADGCGTQLDYGEIEDYNIIIQAVANNCQDPTYTNQCTSGDFINSFVFGAFTSANSGGCGTPGNTNISNYQPTGPNVQAGQTYSVTCGAGGFNQHFGVYIDFNGDGDFTDAGEFFNIGQAQANMTITANVMIPANAVSATRSMRVRSSFDNPLTLADGCGTNLNWGEIEDYNIIIGTGNCPNNLVLNANPIPNGPHQAGVMITSKGTIANGTNVTFSAGNNVELQGDITGQFEVQLGAIFEIRIQGCPQ